MNPPEAASIRCRRCGGVYGFAPRPGRARCPYCSFEQPLSQETLQALERYGGDVERALSQANLAYERAAGWREWADQSRDAVPRFKIAVVVVGVLGVLGVIALGLTQALGLAPDQVGLVVTPLFVLPSPLLFGYVIWQYSSARRGARRAVADDVPVACPNCGARSTLAAGASEQQCAYCQAALVASASVIRRGLDAAELAHRSARLEELEQERLGVAGLAAYDATPYVPYISGGSLLPMLGGCAIALSVEMLNGKEPYSPAIFLLWALFLGVALGLVAVALHRKARRAGYRQALADIGLQFPTFELARLNDVVNWLNRSWPVKYALENLAPGTGFVAASCEVLGYPALLNANFAPSGEQEPYLHLLLATHRPAGATVGPQAYAYANAALARCRHLGFDTVVSEAGLLATADAETVREVRRRPAALHQIATVLVTMAKAEQAAGAVPGAVG